MDDQGGSVALRGLGEGGWERGRGGLLWYLHLQDRGDPLPPRRQA